MRNSLPILLTPLIFCSVALIACDGQASSWEFTVRENTLNAYAKYLEKSPDSVHASDARGRGQSLVPKALLQVSDLLNEKGLGAESILLDILVVDPYEPIALTNLAYVRFLEFYDLIGDKEKSELSDSERFQLNSVTRMLALALRYADDTQVSSKARGVTLKGAVITPARPTINLDEGQSYLSDLIIENLISISQLFYVPSDVGIFVSDFSSALVKISGRLLDENGEAVVGRRIWAVRGSFDGEKVSFTRSVGGDGISQDLFSDTDNDGRFFFAVPKNHPMLVPEEPLSIVFIVRTEEDYQEWKITFSSTNPMISFVCKDSSPFAYVHVHDTSINVGNLSTGCD